MTLLIFNFTVNDGKFSYRVKVTTAYGGDVYSDAVNMLVAGRYINSSSTDREGVIIRTTTTHFHIIYRLFIRKDNSFSFFFKKNFI